VTSANVDVVRANSEAFSRRDVAGMLALYAPDPVVEDRRPVGFGRFEGQDAIASYYEGLFDNVMSAQEELTVVHDEGDVVVVSVRLRARLVDPPDSDELRFAYALRVTLAGGLIKSLEIYENAEAALAVEGE
jgi:ketosteroid isomerase-like protein